MGAVSFSIDPNLVAHLKQVLPLSTFIETGTFEGDSTAQVLPFFEQIHTVELSQEYYLKAAERFAGEAAVQVYHDSSEQFLRRLQPSLQDRSVLYWLDAHWCVADETAGEASQCPLLDELEAIGSLNAESVILIDDARLFLCTPPAPHRIAQWATLDEILKRLYGLSTAHEVMVLNDVILYYPAAIRAGLQKYAYQHSIDWLVVLEKLRYFESLLPQVEEKEAVLQQQNEALQEKEQAIAELTVAAGDRLQIIHEQEQKIAQLEYAIEQLKQEQKQRIQEIRRSKREAVQKIVASAKTQQQFIHDQAEQIKVLKRSLESTVDRRVRRRLSSFSRFFD
ncbi:hypothetical protein IFO70_09185 [Phormidium tenue FACHB-886]|nr:hypothetical protein [Phormidium tenue FACHB-886]